MEEELRFAREDNEKLVAQRAHLKKELELTLDQKESITRAMELEKRRANRAEDELQSLKLQVINYPTTSPLPEFPLCDCFYSKLEF